jgi:hypothetical protein
MGEHLPGFYTERTYRPHVVACGDQQSHQSFNIKDMDLHACNT